VVDTRENLEVVTLNRPHALNAFNPAMVDEILDYFTELHERPEIRVVLLRGAGRAFCAGLDLKEGMADEKGGRVRSQWRNQRRIVRIIELMRSCPQPIVGLGHGAACGGGFSLLLACDIRYAAPNLRMNAAYIKVGLSGCDIGASYLLPRLVGLSLAAELLLTGRFIDAERAKAINLVSDIVPEEQLLNAGLTMAEEMLANSPMGLALTKDALNLNIDAPSLAAAIALEDRQQIMLCGTDDHNEAVAAFREHRPPRYRGR